MHIHNPSFIFICVDLGVEIRRYFDPDVSVPTLQVAFCRNVTPNVKRLKEHVDAGGDPKDLILVDDAKSSAGKGDSKGQISALPLRTYHTYTTPCSLLLGSSR